MSKKPLVSIVIPVYNGSDFLAEAIDSALAQTYDNLEILVINDGSSDQGQTQKVAESYGNRIRYFEKENGGVATALNLGIRKMKGEYFSWLSHDDIYLPNKISEQIGFLQNNPDVKACYSDYFVIDSQNDILSTVKSPWYPREKAIQRLIGEGYINGCTLIINRHCFLEAGFFNEALKYTQDVEMWIRILSHTELAYLPEPLVKQRQHEKQGSVMLSKELYQEVLQMYINTYISQDLHSLVYPQKSQIANETKMALAHLWIGDRVAKSRADYKFAGRAYIRSVTYWRSWKNPARLRLLIGVRNSFLIYRVFLKIIRVVHRFNK